MSKNPKKRAIEVYIKLAGLMLSLVLCSDGQAAVHMPQYIWFTPEQIARLPMNGPAWDKLEQKAKAIIDKPDLSDQDDNTNVIVLAKTLVYLRTGNKDYERQIIKACMDAIDTENDGTTLAFGREFMTYLIAAQHVRFSVDQKAKFDAWVKESLEKELDGRTLRSTHEKRPNNWGTHAGASRLARAIYLEDEGEVKTVADIFKTWVGEQQLHNKFKFRKVEFWQADPASPFAINPKGATKNGHNIDGVLPDEQRRSGKFSWPPEKEGYVYEGLQGALAQAIMLHNAGYDPFSWGDKALLRAFVWLHEQADFPAKGDDTWQPHVINYFYDSDFPAPLPSRPGKAIGYTDWIYQQTETNLRLSEQVID